jgi:hypothetical protein
MFGTSCHNGSLTRHRMPISTKRPKIYIQPSNRSLVEIYTPSGSWNVAPYLCRFTITTGSTRSRTIAKMSNIRRALPSKTTGTKTTKQILRVWKILTSVNNNYWVQNLSQNGSLLKLFIILDIFLSMYKNYYIAIFLSWMRILLYYWAWLMLFIPCWNKKKHWKFFRYIIYDKLYTRKVFLIPLHCITIISILM